MTAVCSYPPVRSGGTGRGLLKSSRPISQYVSSVPLTCNTSIQTSPSPTMDSHQADFGSGPDSEPVRLDYSKPGGNNPQVYCIKLIGIELKTFFMWSNSANARATVLPLSPFCVFSNSIHSYCVMQLYLDLLQVCLDWHTCAFLVSMWYPTFRLVRTLTVLRLMWIL